MIAMAKVEAVLESLRPTEHRLVMDLVCEAGVDVSDWANYAKGKTAPAANPRYCYEWVFTQAPDTTVLNIWHDELVADGDAIVLRGNIKAVQAEAVDRRSGARVGRAVRFDAALRHAWRTSQPLRIIICEGSRRTADPDAKKSRVARRQLDPQPWFVRSYDGANGDFELERGEVDPEVVDQFTIGLVEQTATETKTVTGTVYVRSGEVRRQALKRANGGCEWCGRRGFRLDTGQLYLETHHVVPLSEGGADDVQNVAALCANHHREAHHGTARGQIRKDLLDALGRSTEVSQHKAPGTA